MSSEGGLEGWGLPKPLADPAINDLRCFEMELRMVESELEELEHRYSLHSTPTRPKTELSQRTKPIRRMTNRELEEHIREGPGTPAAGRGDSRVSTPGGFREEVRSGTPTHDERPPPLRRPSPIRYEDLGRIATEPTARGQYQSPLASTPLPPRSPNPSFLDSRDFPNSKAYSLAMKALQDRIQTLESDNLRLQEFASVNESKGYQERSKLQQRYIEEIEEGKAKELDLVKKIEELQDALHAKNRTVTKLEEDNRAVEARVRGVEEEMRKGSQRMESEHEQKSSQLDHVKKQLESRATEIQSLQHLLTKTESDSRLTLEELSHAKELIATLQSELDFLRRNGQAQRSTLQKNLSHVETELSKQNSEYLQRMRQLEVKNKHLQDLADSQKSQLEYLKQEVVELQKMNRQSEEARIALLQGRGHSRPGSSEPAEPGEKQRHSKVHRSKRSSTSQKSKRSETPQDDQYYAEVQTEAVVKEVKESDDPATEERLEREIAAYNRQYKALLQKSQEPGADLASLRVELNSVAAAMEAKSNHLYTIKKQRSFARERQTGLV